MRLDLDIQRSSLSIDEAIPCGLIINELVSNALQHAFPDNRGGTIGVSLRPTGEGRYLLAVRDNGKGFPGGFDIRKTDSLGLQLVNMLAEQLGGVPEIQSAGGTEIRISFGGKR